MPVMFERRSPPGAVEFISLSQEPGYWLRQLQSSEAIESKLASLCSDAAPSPEELRKANPLVKVAQIFGRFDPTGDRIYWTHALKCVPTNGDRDINKEWRRAATRCGEHLREEFRVLGNSEVNLLAFGKYALEMCLAVLDGQDVDQELSISEFMQTNKLPIVYKYRFKDGASKTINLFVFTNPSSEVVKIMKSGGKMTVEEIQELEIKKIKELLGARRKG